jgi:hypothetical protein
MDNPKHPLERKVAVAALSAWQADFGIIGPRLHLSLVFAVHY